MDDALRELVELPGIPGYEEAVRSWIESRLPEGVATSVDSMGNLVATVGEGDRSLLFVAHMDEIGFVVSEVRNDGFLRLKPLGGIDPRAMFGQALRVVTASGEIPGVVTVTPPHLMRDRAKEMGEVPKVESWLVDIGARSGDEARALGVDVLDFAVPDKQFRVLNDKFISSRALDDRLGCWILMQALERVRGSDLRARVHFAFSVQEEVGLRGAGLLARQLEVTHAFAVDSASAADFPGVGADLSPARLGAGACLRVLDSAAIVPRGFIREVQEIASAASIPLQVIFCGGGTDARPFQPEGALAMPLGIPLRYTHSMVEMAHADDVGSTIDLIAAIIGRYAQ
ncbi:MAG: M42 family metallopeptidase [Planctomycetota bacterium]|jgi:putative aminopeptidase FrvX